MSTSECIIDTWKLIYSNDKGAKYNGKLTITTKRLLYDAKFDGNAKKIIGESYFEKWGSEDFIVIPKSRIKQIKLEKSFFSKKVILTLDDNSQHTFNNGMENIDLLAEAINIK